MIVEKKNCINLFAAGTLILFFVISKDILPIPQTGTEEEGDPPVVSGLTLTTYEAILYAIHKLGGMKPDFLPNEPKLDEFRSRLQYLNRAVNAFDRKLRAEFTTHIESKDKKLDLSSQENRKKVTDYCIGILRIKIVNFFCHCNYVELDSSCMLASSFSALIYCI